MSLKTWKDEFYPREAADVMDDEYASARERDLAAVNHSIRKCTGLLPKNLKKHHVGWAAEYLPTIQDRQGPRSTRGEFFIDDAACCFCWQYMRSPSSRLLRFRTTAIPTSKCLECPLYKLHDCNCDDQCRPDSVWTWLRDKHDVAPLLRSLKKLKAALLRKPRPVRTRKTT